MYVVVDKLTKKVMGTYKTRRTASNAVDRLDNAYGAYKYQAVKLQDHQIKVYERIASNNKEGSV